ncbi:Arrestin or S-antigen, domain-containing protein isoform 3 [Cladophialophora immunda]|nr:Arrestin or S-antigen, domain-containing protein isoform 3 [Cladophialophora immunda]
MSTPRQIVSGEMPSFLSSAVPSYSARSRSLALPSSSSSRRGSAIASAIGLRKKSEIDIVLNGEADFVHSYSTYDEIKGRVDVRFEKDTSFDDLNITFEGKSCTYVEKIATTAPTTGRTTGRHTFLKVQQPIPDSLLPENGTFEAGVTYSIPFTFVVPDRLLPFICSHKADNEEIRKQHLQLPPSLGDPSVSGDGRTLMDDLAPDMSKITYSIRARITKWNAVGKLLELADKSERIRLVPAREEAPPLNIDEAESDHVMRKEKSVKKGLFKIGKVGRLTAETTQPRSLRLPHPQKRQIEPISSMATINLRFDPASPDDVPPQLDSIVSKLKVYTFFGAAPYRLIPEARKHDNWSVLHGIYPETVSLSSRCLSTVSWVRHDPSERGSFSSSDLSRRPSGYSTTSTTSIPEPSCAYELGSPFYTASLPVPIALPTPSSSGRPRVFVPTFHSCIVSRTYSVELNISFRTPGANVSSSHMTLKTPIQVSAEAGIPPAQVRETEAAIAAEIEQQFGLYEARQLEESGLGLESPMYEEPSPAALIPGTRHLSLAGHSEVASSSFTTPVLHSGVDAGAPPEYRAGSGFNTFSARDRPGGPRTQAEYTWVWQRRPGTRYTRPPFPLAGLVILAL